MARIPIGIVAPISAHHGISVHATHTPEAE
jgi:hypothetical protein